MGIYIPKHVAVIMDGNGRWGKKRRLSRSEGHYAGAKTMENIIDAGIDLGIDVLTVYAFSSENWSRPQQEVNYLMQLPVKFFKQKLPEFIKRNIKIRISGNLANLPSSTRDVLIKATEATEGNTGIIVNFAFNYGGRDDILQAAKSVLASIHQGEIEPDDVCEELIQRHLYTGELPDPELVIRTGGEKRVSNFLLWQSSRAEFYFTDVLFPDFTGEMLREAILSMQVNSPELNYL